MAHTLFADVYKLAPLVHHEDGFNEDEARRLVEALPDDATWDDVMYRLYVRQSIERGLADSDAGRTVSQDDVRTLLRDRFGIVQRLEFYSVADLKRKFRRRRD